MGIWASPPNRPPAEAADILAKVFSLDVGSNVRRFKKGDRVYALALANPKGGFYAEYAAVGADHASPIPAR